MYNSNANSARLNNRNDMIIKVGEFNLSCLIKISKNKYMIVSKMVIMTLKFRKEIIMKKIIFIVVRSP